jgi:Na+/H+-dicarboxylate symporter
VGAGGVPGGSLMLLFIILGTMGLNEQQVAVIVALALGINPILDMFETMNNITGDLVCTYVVASNEKLLDAEESCLTNEADGG